MSRKKRIIVIAALLAAFLLTCLTSVYLAPAPIGLRPPRPIGGTPAGKAMLPLTSSDGPGWVVYRVDRRQVIEVVGTFLGAGPTYDPVAVVRDEAGFRYYHWEHGWIGDTYDAMVDVGGGLIITRKGEHLICLDPTGRERFRTDQADRILANTAIIPIEPPLLAARRNDQWGYITLDGTVAIDFQFKFAFPFTGGRGLVMTDAVKDAPAWTFVDEEGEPLFGQSFNLAHPFSEGRASVRVGDKMGVIDVEGNWVVVPQWRSVSTFSEGLAAIKDEATNRSGYIDTQGALVIPPKFDLAQPFVRQLAIVEDDETEKHGVIDPAGNWVVSPQFNHLLAVGGGYLYFKRDGTHGYIDSYDGTEVLSTPIPQPLDRMWGLWPER